jgi:DNA-directed RNA polymerase sigma subunit (sigma70/sigma32)
MADSKQKVHADLRKSQADFESLDAQRERAGAVRRKSFMRAQEAGLTLREIGEIVGLHHTRVGQIIRGE